MSKTLIFGRTLLGLALIGLGLEPFITGHLPAALVPLQHPLPAWVAMLLGGMLVATALATVTGRLALAPVVLIAFPALVLLTSQLPALARAPDDPTVWSGVFQVVAFSAATLLLVRPLLGRVLFASALFVFGIQHFMYAEFVASLIPSWIPGHLFWTYATGLGFCAAAVSAVTGRLTRAAGLCLALMFSSWVLVLHLPRILTDSTKEGEWSSGMVALAMAGASLLLAGILDGREPDSVTGRTYVTRLTSEPF